MNVQHSFPLDDPLTKVSTIWTLVLITAQSTLTIRYEYTIFGYEKKINHLHWLSQLLLNHGEEFLKGSIKLPSLMRIVLKSPDLSYNGCHRSKKCHHQGILAHSRCFFGTLLAGSKRLEQLGKRELRVLALAPVILLTSLQMDDAFLMASYRIQKISMYPMWEPIIGEGGARGRRREKGGEPDLLTPPADHEAKIMTLWDYPSNQSCGKVSTVYTITSRHLFDKYTIWTKIL